MLCWQKAHIEEDFDACDAYIVAEDEDKPSQMCHCIPGEDIWTKFELLPTPPRSPSRPQPKTFISTAADKLRMVLTTRDNEAANKLVVDAENVETRWEDYLISDCMWGNGSSLRSKTRSAAGTNASDNVQEGNIEDKLQPDDTIASFSASECINPSSVLASVSPLTDHSHYAAQLVPTPPGSSGCSSESDEEIDVVTVENKPKRRTSSSHLRSPPAKRLRATPPPVRSTTPSPSIQLKPRRDSQPRISNTPSLAGQRRVYVRRSSSKNEDSDENELEYKRTTHNVLERKRRNDLKSSFQLLRMNVPDLKENEKAPKVTILKKAGEYIREVRRDQDRLLAELARQKQTHEALVKQYNALNQGAVSQLVDIIQ